MNSGSYPSHRGAGGGGVDGTQWRKDKRELRVQKRRQCGGGGIHDEDMILWMRKGHEVTRGWK